MNTPNEIEALMRNGAEQAIQLTEEEWEKVQSYVLRELNNLQISNKAVLSVCQKALANCRPKK